MPVAFEPFSPHWRHDPYDVYRRLRDHDPVHFAPEAQMFCVSRHEDATTVLRHPERFSSSAMNEVLRPDLGPWRPRSVLALLRFLFRAKLDPLAVQRRGNLLTTDGPRHDRLRALVSRGFTPRRIAAWEPRIREIVGGLLRGLEPGRRFDVVQGLAVPLPVTLIAEMLGIDPQRRADFKRWSDSLVAVMSGAARSNPLESGHLLELGELYAHLRTVIAERRRAPADDLLSVLVAPSKDGVLDAIDVTQFVVLLLVAGNETTTNLIGNAANALLDHPEVLAKVARRPELVPGVVEEAVRFDAPVQMVFRAATQDTDLAGTRIPAGATVAVLLGSANRDERVFEAPDRFDPERDARAHLGFGSGAHFCLGAALARLESQIALEALVPELAVCKREGPAPPLVDSFLVRGRVALPVVREPGL